MRIYNTLTRKKEEFVAREEGKVSLYTCGPTVYNDIHIGNARTFISFDTIRRYLQWRGHEVMFVQNVTDVDDKIINKANEEGRDASEVAAYYTQAFIDAMRAVGVLDPTVRPKATETIDDMIELIERLIASDHAYESEGDVYFAVRSFPEYGKLSGRDVDDLRSGARIAVDQRKRDPLDFTLWKAAKQGEPHWSSPWGEGRPGWHIECSAMSEKQLGLPFDIHGGGIDLVFPHHENEIAQSEAATGVPFAHYWMHGGMLQINDEKMSKSLGNFMLLKDVLKRYPASVIRLFMLQTHYRSPLDFSDARLDEAVAALERITTFIRNARWATQQLDEGSDSGGGVKSAVRDGEGSAGAGADSDSVTDIDSENSKHSSRQAFSQIIDDAYDQFIASMDDDFNTAGALGSVFEIVKSGNAFLQANAEGLGAEDAKLLEHAVVTIEELLSALGVAVKSDADQNEADDNVEVEALLEQRQQARAEKNWELADSLRDRIDALGYVIEDTAQGARVVRKA